MPRSRRIADRIAREGLLALGTGGRMGAPGSYHALEGRIAISGRETATDTLDPLVPVYAAMSEAEFQRHVVGALRDRGWTVWTVPDMRKTTAGLPDVIAVSPKERPPRRLLMLELKSSTGRLRREQRSALAALCQVEEILATMLRPAEWPAVLAFLDGGSDEQR